MDKVSNGKSSYLEPQRKQVLKRAVHLFLAPTSSWIKKHEASGTFIVPIIHPGDRNFAKTQSHAFKGIQQKLFPEFFFSLIFKPVQDGQRRACSSIFQVRRQAHTVTCPCLAKATHL